MGTPTMEDVAQLAGVSRSLVSLVFQDAPNVSATRRAAVQDAAEQLGYRPNRLARNLARGRSMTIGVVVDDLQNPFFARTVEGVEEGAEAAGYHLLVANGARDQDRTAVATSTFVDLQVDGLITIGARGGIDVVRCAAATTPLVLVASEVSSGPIDTVNSDELTGAGLAVEHLAASGHTRIAHVDGGLGASAADRRAGYRAAMDQLGLSRYIDVITSDFTHDAGRKAAIAIAASTEMPSAILAANDLNALGLWSEFNRLGIEVPQDVSIVGYDDTAMAGLGAEGLTTIHQPVFEMGTRAAELLLEQLQGRRDDVVHEVPHTQPGNAIEHAATLSYPKEDGARHDHRLKEDGARHDHRC